MGRSVRVSVWRWVSLARGIRVEGVGVWVRMWMSEGVSVNESGSLHMYGCESVRIWIRSVRQSVNEGVGGVWNIYRQGV